MDQYHLEFEQDSEISLPQASIQYYPQFFSAEQADKLFTLLIKQLDWRQDHIRMYGKQHLIPRLQVWYGDPDARYQYSGIDMSPLSWTPVLQQIRQQCENDAGCRFNSVLCNLYRDGQDSVGLHADDEPELGENPVIASVSLGQSRTLLFKHKSTSQRHKLELQHGSLLLMSGLTQQHWLHGINKNPSVTKPRVNLTFRQVKNSYK